MLVDRQAGLIYISVHIVKRMLGFLFRQKNVQSSDSLRYLR